MIHNLSSTPSILNQFIAELRDVHIQTDRMRFRHNLERIGEIIAYELSKTLSFESKTIQTPLGLAQTALPSAPPVIAGILRAGLPLQQGLMNIFDQAEQAFISAYRKHDALDNFEICVEYIACPCIQDKILIMADPMLATGQSIVKAVEFISEYGVPSAVHIVAAIASQQGVHYVREHLPNASIWVGAIDPELTPLSYIVPGLGDAGDLAFGNKIQR